MQEEQNQNKGKQQEDKEKKQILREDTGLTTPPSDRAYITTKGEMAPNANRPEPGQDVPPHERTEGIP